MAKNISNKKNNVALNRPFSMKTSKNVQKPNLQTTKVNGKKVRLSAKEIRDSKKSK